MELSRYYLSQMLQNERKGLIYKTAFLLKSFKGLWMNTIILNQKNGAGRRGMERENYRKRELL